MEVVVIDKATFERMLSGFENFAKKVERLCREYEDLGERKWLDSDDVQAARYQSKNPTDDAGERYAGLHQDKPQGVLQAGGCEGCLSRGRNETAYWRQ